MKIKAPKILPWIARNRGERLVRNPACGEEDKDL
jgi:hypothetical protein